MSRTPREHDPQRAPDRPFELREVVDAEGITVELLVEGERLFSGRVRDVDLAEMFRMLRLAREDVVAQLGRELVARFEQERARVNLSPPVPASTAGGEGDGDRLVSRYVTDGGAGSRLGLPGTTSRLVPSVRTMSQRSFGAGCETTYIASSRKPGPARSESCSVCSTGCRRNEKINEPSCRHYWSVEWYRESHGP